MTTVRITNWQTFIKAGREFLDANWGCPMYQLGEILDELYIAAYSSGQLPPSGEELNDFLHMSILLCHKSLLRQQPVPVVACRKMAWRLLEEHWNRQKAVWQ